MPDSGVRHEKRYRRRHDPDLTVARGVSTRARIGVGAVVVLLIGGLALTVLVSLVGNRGQGTPVPLPTETSFPTAQGEASLYVHVSGAVSASGVYQLAEGDRVIDAVAAAGGFAADADQAAVNLARFVVDGEQIVVPAVGEAPPPVADAGGGAAGPGININTASALDLETLPGVGPALAQSIVDWRTENGPFGSVDDLLNVSGIGEKTLEGFREQVTI
ncbi:hypothetical protein GCM10027416_15500 [Okibacterium endophyticum]